MNPRPSPRSDLWSHSQDKPRWGLILSLLAGVVTISILSIQLYFNSLSTRLSDEPAAPQALAGSQNAKTAASTSSSSEETVPTPTNDPVASSREAIVLADAVFDQNTTVVTTAKLPSAPEVVPVDDPWPYLERALASSDTESPSTQAFSDYVRSGPPRNAGRRPLAICVLGTLSLGEEKLLGTTRELLGATFDAPVQVRRRITLNDLPSGALRVDARFHDRQLVTPEILHRVLQTELPDGTFGFLGLSTAEFFPIPTPMFLHTQDVMGTRTSVIAWRPLGEAAMTADEHQRILTRALMAGVRGTAPLFGLSECPHEACLLKPDVDGAESHLCPACLHKLCWNLDVAPTTWLKHQQAFFEKAGLRAEAARCREWRRQLQERATSSDR